MNPRYLRPLQPLRGEVATKRLIIQAQPHLNNQKCSINYLRDEMTVTVLLWVLLMAPGPEPSWQVTSEWMREYWYELTSVVGIFGGAIAGVFKMVLNGKKMSPLRGFMYWFVAVMIGFVGWILAISTMQPKPLGGIAIAILAGYLGFILSDKYDENAKKAKKPSDVLDLGNNQNDSDS